MHWTDKAKNPDQDDERILIDLLIEQMALKVQMQELNFAALMEKLGLTQHQIYRVKNRNLAHIIEQGRALASRRRSGYSCDSH